MEILLPIIVLGSLGALFGLWLAFVQKIFVVKKDERTEHIFTLLPGSNCGACGKAGCFGLAQALSKGELDTITCPILHEKEREEIAEYLGIKVEEEHKKVATLICNGGNTCKDKFRYHGPKECDIANLMLEGPKACAFGCIGFGTCVSACPFGAIRMNEQSLPEIDIEKCTACGKCITACPKGVLVLSPVKSQYHIQCHSIDRGPDVMKACKTGCIACGKCVKACPVEAITITNNLALIDYTKCTNCGECIKVCPTKAIGRRKPDGE